MSRLAFVDCETVRIGTEHGSALWELAILLHEGGATAEVEYLYQLRPNLEHADAMALRIGGYYDRYVEDSADQVCRNLERFLAGRVADMENVAART